jgi:hypothetical protein
MKSVEVLEKYPLATEVIRQWFFNELIESIGIAEDVPEEFKQAMLKEGVSNERLAILIDAQPRTLFDVFDENNIIIVIGYHENFGFNYAVCEDDNQQHYFKTRKEAELCSVEVAFEILEEQLKPIDLPNLEE